MTRQPESKIVNAILDALNALPNTHARKTHGSRYSVGWPDLVVCHRGTMCMLEVKTATGQATPRQQYELAKWRAAGARAAVVRSVEEALVAIGYPMIQKTLDDVMAGVARDIEARLGPPPKWNVEYSCSACGAIHPSGTPCVSDSVPALLSPARKITTHDEARALGLHLPPPDPED